jgi:phosphomannomutase/phosphoglucomutase
MDLKEKFGEVTHITIRKHVDKRLIWVLGLFGIITMAIPSWLMVDDWRHAGVFSETVEEARQAVDSMMQPIQALNRVMEDEQVQALAIRALENPQTLEDLAAYIKGRISQVTSVNVYGADLSAVRPVDLGPNGYALYDMVQSTLEGGKGLVQIHHVLQPKMAFDSTAIVSGGENIGVLVLGLDPGYFISPLNPDFSALGFIRLTQYNGRQPPSNIREWGDPGLLGEVPDRLNVPGTLFRIEFPLYDNIGLIGRWTVVLMILAGALSLTGAIVLYRSNLRWETEENLRQEKNTAMARTPGRQMDDQQAPADATFKPAPEPESRSNDTVNRTGSVGAAAPPEPLPDPPRMRLHFDITEKQKLKEAEHSPVQLTPGIFRAYDIRGVIDKTLDSGIARSIGQAVGSTVLERDAGPVIVARDGRLSGPYLMEGVIDGILSTGCDVLDIGAVPTGVLYYAAHEMGAGSGVMITGSHNPPDYNGFKIMVGGDTLHGAAITALYERIKNSDLLEGEGSVTSRDVVPDYIQRIAGDIHVERDLKVVIDCGNGIGGVCAAETLRAIGVEVLPLFDEVDGTFPNHHPDPSEPENLVDLIESVRLMNADLGLALDGDADRLGVVTLAGNIIYPDRIMMLLAMDVLDRHPGATILYDVKCTGHLPKVIREAGGNPVMYKTGHSLMKAKMKEIGSPFAGEMSGHFFFKDRWYGVDDGIYAAARLLEILGSTEAPPEAILNALPTSYSTPELKVQMLEGENHGFVEAFKAVARFDNASISTIDGIRADFDDGWGLVRASNTTPILVVRFDAETPEALERIKTLFRSQMLRVSPDLELPF